MTRRPNRTAFLITSAILFSALCTATPAKTIYVDGDTTGANNGTSWTDAYTFLQEALTNAERSEKPIEIHVAQGTYKPNEGLMAIPEFDWRTATFKLINGVTVRGAYAGVSEPDPNARDVSSYSTILSGDLNGNDIGVVDASDLINPYEPSRAENSFHVVTGSGTDNTAGLDGFIITAGNDARHLSVPGCRGGGMYNDHGSPTVTECTFRWNRGSGMANSESSPTLTDCTFSNNCGNGMHNTHSSPILTNCTFNGNDGGGMFNRESSNPTLTNCIFSGNHVRSFLEGGDGGGMYNRGSSPTLTDCTFSGNSASGGGGGMSNDGSTPILTNCTFSNNSAEFNGGGMSNSNSSPTLIDCAFSANVATGHIWSHDLETEPGDGGGMFNYESNPILANCTFSGNSAWKGGGMYNGASRPTLNNCTFSGNSAQSRLGAGIAGGMYNGASSPVLTNCTFAQNSAKNGNALVCDSHEQKYPSNVELVNCILWDDGDEIRNNDGSTIKITYSNIQGGFSGKGNIDADPLFANTGCWIDIDNPNTVVEPDDPHAVLVDGDYHMKSETGRWDPVSGSWIKDDVTSPCIDAGDPDSDLDGEIWPHGGRINLGAYGGTRQASMSTQPQSMSLPYILYIYDRKVEAAESFESLLNDYGCATTLIGLGEAATVVLDPYDLIIVGNDTGFTSHWGDAESVAAIEASGRPVVAIGEGGYAFLGQLGLSIGWPNGAHGNDDSISVIDPDSSHFNIPYLIDIPEDKTLRLYTETEHVGLYLWPVVPETVTALGGKVDSVTYYPLALEHDRYLLCGFAAPPENMTEVGKDLFANIVIRAANTAWETGAQ